MKDLLETLQALQNTPIPNFLVISGFVFLLLAFIGKVGAVIELPKERQKWAGVTGTVFLILGVSLFILPKGINTTPHLQPSNKTDIPFNAPTPRDAIKAQTKAQPDTSKNPETQSEFKLDTAAYGAGDTIGENLVIRQESNGEKYVGGSDTTDSKTGKLGRLEFNPIRLSKKFEFIVNADWNSGFTQTISLISGESELVIRFFNDSLNYISFNKERRWINDTNWKQGAIVNRMVLYISDGAAKFYINDALHSVISLDNPNAVYTKLIMNGIKKGDRLFEVSGRNL